MKNSNPHNFRKFPKTSIAEFNFSEVTRPKPAILFYQEGIYLRTEIKIFLCHDKKLFYIAGEIK